MRYVLFVFGLIIAVLQMQAMHDNNPFKINNDIQKTNNICQYNDDIEKCIDI